MNSSHDTFTCADVQELLPDLLGGELESAMAQAVERHALACPSCSRELAESRAAIGLVKRAAAPPAREQAPIRFRNNTPSIPWRPLALAASLAIAFGLGMAAGRSNSSPAMASRDDNTNSNPTESIATRYRQAATASPGASSLGLALISIARRE